MCSPSTADQTGGCLTFILSRRATSAYSLPLVISYLFSWFSSSLIILSFQPPHLWASHLPSFLFGSSLLLCHPCVERDDQTWKKKKKKIEYSMLLPWQLHPGAEPVLFHRHACSLSLILPPLAVLRLKLTSDEKEEKDRPAGETREKAALVREEWRFITLPGNNVLFSVMTHYYWWWIISKTDIVSELHTVYNKGNTQCFPCTVRCFLLLCRGFGCWVDGSDCG